MAARFLKEPWLIAAQRTLANDPITAVVMDTTPTVVAPHQPRLDWQMWFAALGSYQVKATFLLFLFFSPSFFFSQFYPLLHIYFYFFPPNSPLLSIFLPLLP
jgi:hypothetical protein